MTIKKYVSILLLFFAFSSNAMEKKPNFNANRSTIKYGIFSCKDKIYSDNRKAHVVFNTDQPFCNWYAEILKREGQTLKYGDLEVYVSKGIVSVNTGINKPGITLKLVLNPIKKNGEPVYGESFFSARTNKQTRTSNAKETLEKFLKLLSENYYKFK